MDDQTLARQLLSAARHDLLECARILDVDWEARARMMDGNSAAAERWRADQYALKVEAAMRVFEATRQRCPRAFEFDAHYEID